MDICTVDHRTGRIVGWGDDETVDELRRRLAAESAAALALLLELTGCTPGEVRAALDRHLVGAPAARWA